VVINCFELVLFTSVVRYLLIFVDNISKDGSDISWTICKQSAPCSRQITTPTPHHSIFTGRMLFLMPNLMWKHWWSNYKLISSFYIFAASAAWSQCIFVHTISCSITLTAHSELCIFTDIYGVLLTFSGLASQSESSTVIVQKAAGSTHLWTCFQPHGSHQCQWSICLFIFSFVYSLSIWICIWLAVLSEK